MPPMLSPAAKSFRLQLIAAAHCKGLASGVHLWVADDVPGGVICAGCVERRARADVIASPGDDEPLEATAP